MERCKYRLVIEQFESAFRHKVGYYFIHPRPSDILPTDDGLVYLFISDRRYSQVKLPTEKLAYWGRIRCNNCSRELGNIEEVAEHLKLGHTIEVVEPSIGKFEKLRPRKVVIDI